ncbi:MAG: hypothetical protein COU67_01175 [Candidatus Pacebacteria bacterium CG10_big_fil_rev_8_21_14_0_10_44_54]|nr:MAG: hypothetical protein COU67_01175 [Candidatus Pacebacteria bacterium CG10_big_fil_rev_8_21_14_0_10_44_54]
MKTKRNANLTSEQRLQHMAVEANRTLFTCTSVFPFALFPDKIIVDSTKVVIHKKVFFLSSEVITILLQDIRLVEMNTGPFFAKLQFEVFGFDDKSISIRYLRRSDAARIKDLVMGLVAVKDTGINLKHVDSGSLVRSAKKIGSPSAK